MTDEETRQYVRDMEEQDTCDHHAVLLEAFLNRWGTPSLLERLCATIGQRVHRTLQQRFTLLCLSWLKYLSQAGPDQYDARNADSVRVAKALAPEIDTVTNGTWHLPTI